MKLAFKRATLYLRICVLVVVGGAIALTLFKNRNNDVSVWFFGLTDTEQKINVVWLMLCTSVGTLIAWWAASLVWGLIRDARELRNVDAAKHAAESAREREKSLDDRERQLKRKFADGDASGDEIKEE